MLGWGTQFFDYDRDGDLDLFVANGHVYPQAASTIAGTSYPQRNQLIRNDGGNRLIDIGAAAGPGMALKRVSRGASFGDYDNDGDVDIFVVNLDEASTLLRNDFALRQQLARGPTFGPWSQSRRRRCQDPFTSRWPLPVADG